MARTIFTRRFAIGACLAMLALIASRPAAAQTPQTDPRWNAWIGCWASGPFDALAGSLSRPVCVVPASQSAVDVIAIVDGKITSRERIDASGDRRTTDRDGCTGWETARWSDNGRRVYLQSEHQCSTGGKRTSSGLIAMSPEGEWLDIVSVTLGENTGVRVLRHRSITDPAPLPAEVRAPLQSVPTSRLRDARIAAVAPLTVADIVDASHQLDSTVVSAWLNDLRQPIAVDAKRLAVLADARVPGPVIDMMVALAYPDAFAVPPSPTAAGLLATNQPGGGGGPVGFGSGDRLANSDCTNTFSIFGFDNCGRFGEPFGYSPFYGYSYSPFGYMWAGYLPFGYSQYGLNRYGFGSYGGYGGYGGWYGSGPVVVIRAPDNATHGQVVNGRGYSSGGAGTTAALPPASSGSSGSSSSSGGSSGGSVGTASSGGGDRTAVPR